MPAPNGWSQGLFASLTGFQNIDALLIGSRWAGVVTYSFPYLWVYLVDKSNDWIWGNVREWGALERLV
jgi:hypothetical protein